MLLFLYLNNECYAFSVQTWSQLQGYVRELQMCHKPVRTDQQRQQPILEMYDDKLTKGTT